jgi:hypothetical protein
MHDAVQARSAILAFAVVMLIGCSPDQDPPTGLRGSAAAADITVITPEFTVAASTADERTVSVATDGINALVPYVANGVVKAKLVSSAGQVVAAINLGRHGVAPRVVWNWNSSHYVIMWADVDDSQHRVWGWELTASGVPIESAVPISNTTDVASVSGAAVSNDGIFVAYLTNDGTLKARYLYSTATLLETVTISNQATTSLSGNVTTNYQSFLVTYMASSPSGVGVYAKRFSHVSDPRVGPKITIDDNAAAAPFGSVWTGYQHLVTWNKNRGVTGQDVMAQRINADGGKQGGKIVVDGSSGWQVGGFVLRYGNAALISWADLRTGSGGPTARAKVIDVNSETVLGTQIFFQRNTTTRKIAVPIGTEMNDGIFFAVNRVTLGDNTDISLATEWDIKGVTLSPLNP